MLAEKNIQNICRGVAELLRNERERQKLSMNMLAERSGLSQASVSYIERGMRIPSLDTLLRIAAALDVDLGALIQRASKAANRSSKA